MLEFVKYDPETPVEERKGSPVCVVTYPDPCGRAAVGEVWSMPFCEAHGEEAALAARIEAHEDAEREFQALINAEGERITRNFLIIAALRELRVPGPGADLDAHKAHDRAILAAYPLDYAAEEALTDRGTLAFDYADPDAGPHDWWCEAREMVVGWMRVAYEAGQSPLLAALEPIRERATVQQELARRDMERRYIEPRRAEREERKRREAERDPSAEILGAVNGDLGGAIDRLEELPDEGAFDAEAIRKARQAIAEAGYLVASEQRKLAERSRPAV